MQLSKSKLFAALGAVLLIGSAVTAASIDQVLQAGERRINDGAAAQKRIVAMAEEADQMLADYKGQVKVLEGLAVYQDLIGKQVANQEEEKTNLTESIARVGDIERDIVPLMVEMVQGLDQFVKLDMPFLMEERTKRVADLQELLERPDVSRAEKFRKVLEAYAIETDFGNTIERYKGKLEVEAGKEMEVDFLRIGRLSLSYQSADGKYTGAFNPASRQYEALSAADYKNQVAMGLKVAGKEVSPDLFIVPVPAGGQ